MKIRSITYFLNPGWPLDEAALQLAGEFIKAAQPTYEQAGYEVQTVRLATTPFPTLLGDIKEGLLQRPTALPRYFEQQSRSCHAG